MLTSRLDKVKGKHGTMVYRNPVLMGLEKWYTTDNLYTNKFYEEWSTTDRRLKFTRWLTRNYPSLTPGELSRIGQEYAASKSISFKLSCRHNDIMRAGTSPHYKSCYAEPGYKGQLGNNYQQTALYCANDRDLAVLYVPDKAGHFQYRAFVRHLYVLPYDCNIINDCNEHHMRTKGREGLWFTRHYGQEALAIPIAKALARETGRDVYLPNPLTLHDNNLYMAMGYSRLLWPTVSKWEYDDGLLGVFRDRKWLQRHSILVTPQGERLFSYRRENA